MYRRKSHSTVKLQIETPFFACRNGARRMQEQVESQMSSGTKRHTKVDGTSTLNPHLHKQYGCDGENTDGTIKRTSTAQAKERV